MVQLCWLSLIKWRHDAFLLGDIAAFSWPTISQHVARTSSFCILLPPAGAGGAKWSLSAVKYKCYLNSVNRQVGVRIQGVIAFKKPIRPKFNPQAIPESLTSPDCVAASCWIVASGLTDSSVVQSAHAKRQPCVRSSSPTNQRRFSEVRRHTPPEPQPAMLGPIIAQLFSNSWLWRSHFKIQIWPK